MRQSIRLVLVISGLCLIRSASAADVDFAHEVVPILQKHCLQCHGGNEAEGGFSINTRELFLESDAAVIGSATDSYFLELVQSTDVDAQMPPKDRPRLSKDEIATLVGWVNQGLPWTEGFTFAASTYQAPLLPRQVELPEGDANPIDLILHRYLDQRSLPLPPRVDDEVFLRRAHMDLIGLLPSEEQRQAFLDDPSPDRRSKLVDRLLDDQLAYAEHWLTFWNDLLRNDYEGTGFITGGRTQISEWLYRSLVDNKSFDVLTRELISPPSDDSRGFIDGIKWRGAVSAGQTVEIQFAQSVAQSFLGINLKCASCHDSFIDRWKLSDAYSLAAVYATDSLEIARCDKPTGARATAGWLFPELGNVDANLPRDERLRQLASLVTHRDNGRYARTIVNRLWAQLMGRGIVHPLDAMHTQPWNEDLLDFLANDLVIHEYDLKAVLRRIATSDAYNARCEILDDDPNNETTYVYAGPRAKRMTAEQFMDAIWQVTGAAPVGFDAPVLRGVLDPELLASVEIKGDWIWGESAANGGQPPAGESLSFRKQVKLSSKAVSGVAVVSADNSFELFVNNRRVTSSDEWTKPQVVALAPWLVKGDNTIVIIGRNAGTKPNSAGVFFQAQFALEDGTSHTLMSDATWEYSDKAPAGREGRLGALAGPFRSVVHCDDRNVYQRINPDLRRGLAMASMTQPSMVRASLLKSDFLMRSLGRPNRDQIVTSRPNDLTTLEAIDLANGNTLSDALRKGAERLTHETDEPEAIAATIYRQTLSREPTDAEKRLVIELLGDSPSVDTVQDLLWAICVSPEFMVVR